MIGRVIAHGRPATTPTGSSSGATAQSPAAQGRKLFQQLGCIACHETRPSRPPLAGLYGQPVPLSDGSTVIADENYIRESILTPSATDRGRLPADHAVVRGRLSEEEIAGADRVHQVASGRPRRELAAAATGAAGTERGRANRQPVTAPTGGVPSP